MFHILLIPLLLSCTVNARGFGGWGHGGKWGNGWGDSDHTPSWPGEPETAGFIATTIQHQANTPTVQSSPTLSTNQPLPTIPQGSSSRSNIGTTTHSSSASTGITTSSFSSSSILTDAHDKANTSLSTTSTTVSGITLSSSSTLTSTSDIQPTTSDVNAAPASDLGTSNSKVLTIVGICVAVGLLFLAIAGYLIFRRYSKHPEIGFTSDRMVKGPAPGVSIYHPPPDTSSFGGTFTSNSPLIPAHHDVENASEKIPNPFASDLDYCYSTHSENSFDDARSDVSDVVATVPGPSVHTAIPQPAYTRH